MADLEKHARDYIAEAKAAVESVTAGELRAEIEGGDVTVVDVREDRERWTDGAIPGSVHASRGGIEYSADPESDYHLDAFDPDRRYVCHRSRSAEPARDQTEPGVDPVSTPGVPVRTLNFILPGGKREPWRIRKPREVTGPVGNREPGRDPGIGPGTGSP